METLNKAVDAAQRKLSSATEPKIQRWFSKREIATRYGVNPTQNHPRHSFDHLVGEREQLRSGLIQHSTHSFLRLWTNATTSRCSASGTWNFARVAAA